MRSSGLVLFACAGLLLSGGAILGGSVSWSLLRMSYYFWTSDLGVELSSSVLFLAGALLCLPTCWLSTVVPYHTKSLPLTATLMALVSVAMVTLSVGMASVSGLSRAVREPATLNTSMLRAMAIDAFDPAVRSSFAAMQVELRCCGVQSYSDWYLHRRTLPPACCGRVWNGKVIMGRGDTCDVPLYSMGCLRPALAELRYFANSLTALASGIVIVMAVTLFAAAYTLVAGVVERGEARAHKAAPAALRLACVAHAPALGAHPACVAHAPALGAHPACVAHASHPALVPRPPPLVALTAPAALPHDSSM